MRAFETETCASGGESDIGQATAHFAPSPQSPVPSLPVPSPTHHIDKNLLTGLNHHSFVLSHFI